MKYKFSKKIAASVFVLLATLAGFASPVASIIVEEIGDFVVDQDCYGLCPEAVND